MLRDLVDGVLGELHGVRRLPRRHYVGGLVDLRVAHRSDLRQQSTMLGEGVGQSWVFEASLVAARLAPHAPAVSPQDRVGAIDHGVLSEREGAAVTAASRERLRVLDVVSCLLQQVVCLRGGGTLS